MPTPGGLPRRGETIEWWSTPTRTEKTQKVAEAEVLRRSTGDLWGVQVKWKSGPKKGRTEWITEGQYWMTRGNLKIKGH